MKTLLFISVLFFAFKSYSQITITGTLYDSKGPIIGGAIAELNTANGTYTYDGTFKLIVASKESILEFSMMGYNSQQVTVGEDTVFNIILNVGGGYDCFEYCIPRQTHKIATTVQSKKFYSFSSDSYFYRYHGDVKLDYQSNFNKESQTNIRISKHITMGTNTKYFRLKVGLGYETSKLAMYKYTQNVIYSKLSFRILIPIIKESYNTLYVGYNFDKYGIGYKSQIYYHFKNYYGNSVSLKYFYWEDNYSLEIKAINKIPRSSFKTILGYQNVNSHNIYFGGLQYTWDKY